MGRGNSRQHHGRSTGPSLGYLARGRRMKYELITPEGLVLYLAMQQPDDKGMRTLNAPLEINVPKQWSKHLDCLAEFYMPPGFKGVDYKLISRIVNGITSLALNPDNDEKLVLNGVSCHIIMPEIQSEGLGLALRAGIGIQRIDGIPTLCAWVNFDHLQGTYGVMRVGWLWHAFLEFLVGECHIPSLRPGEYACSHHLCAPQIPP